MNSVLQGKLEGDGMDTGNSSPRQNVEYRVYNNLEHCVPSA